MLPRRFVSHACSPSRQQRILSTIITIRPFDSLPRKKIPLNNIFSRFFAQLLLYPATLLHNARKLFLCCRAC
ncbi:hypothetical protein FOXYSP1_04207 [Fusarium oxysporum f. sp. phaseoli]